MDAHFVMIELEKLGKEKIKKQYINQEASEPLFGVATGEMKPLFKQTGLNQELANQLYDTGNYDAMYFAGMIAEPKTMSKDNFNDWIEKAYFHMISDYIVAVTLAESPLAQEIADEWINRKEELCMSAGWSCYEWLLGSRPDNEFSKEKLQSMLDKVEVSIHSQPDRTKYAMNNFVIAVGVSYTPLHEAALKTAEGIGPVKVLRGTTICKTPLATDSISKAASKGRIGFKRKSVRC